MTDLTTTQKICLDLQADLKQAEAELSQKPTIEKISLVNWLKSKLSFYNSEHYPEYKRENGETK